MFKLPHNCNHLTCQESNVPNSPSQASTEGEPRTSRLSSWIYKRQRNQRSNCQHPLDHRKSKRIPEKHHLLYWLYQSLWVCGSQQTVENSFSLVQSVQSFSCVQLLATPRIAAGQASLSIINSQSSLKLTSIESVMPSNHLILCRALLLLPSIFPSIRVFSNESTLHMRWPKNWRFSFSIIPTKVHPGLTSCRMDWLDLLAVQGTVKSLLQYHSSKASILWCLAFFTVQLSHPYMTTGKAIALTRRTLVGKVMSLLLNMLSRLVITFLPRTKCLLSFF